MDIEVKCMDGKLLIPSEYMDKEVGIKFRCEKCHGVFTYNATRLTDRGGIPCGFCGQRYEVAFQRKAGGLLGFLSSLTSKGPNVDGLIKALQSEKPEKVRDAAIQLGELGDARAVEALVNLTKTSSPGMNLQSAMRGLALSGPAAIELLVRELGTGPRAQEVLDAMGERAVEPCINLLASDEIVLRCGAIKFFDHHADSRAIRPLFDTLKDFEAPEFPQRLKEIKATCFRTMDEFKYGVKNALTYQGMNTREYDLEEIIAFAKDKNKAIREIARELLIRVLPIKDRSISNDQRVIDVLKPDA